jgi:hypothetical protein
MTPLQLYLSAIQAEGKRTPGKSLALPTTGHPPTFDQLVEIILAAITCRFSVGVLCLTETALADWSNWPGRLTPSLATFDVLDLNQASLADWQSFLSSQSYDLTVLHGVCTELQASVLSTGYVTALVDAAPAGTIILA